MFENFRYTNEWRDGRTTILFFEANVGNRDLQGIDILEDDEDGQDELHGHDQAAFGAPGRRGSVWQRVWASAERGYDCRPLRM